MVVTIRSDLGFELEGILAGETSSEIKHGNSCVDFDNLWLSPNHPSGPYVLQFAGFPDGNSEANFSRCIFDCTQQSMSQLRTMECISKDSFAPSCTASFYLSPRSLATDMRVSIDVANSDFSAENEFVS